MASLQELLAELRGKFDITAFSKPKTATRPLDRGYWVEAFRRMFVEGHREGRDDLLFFVRAKHKDKVVDVARRDARALPDVSDLSYIWDETLYLNLILHEFEYQLTCSIITVHHESTRIRQVLRTKSVQLYPSPNQHRMDKKGQLTDVAYPHIVFSVENFEEVFSDIWLDNVEEKVAVQMVAKNKDTALNKVVFVGAVGYEAIKDECLRKEKDQPSMGDKLMKLTGYLGKRSKVDDLSRTYHFLQMRGPDGNGFAEMAVSKVEAAAAPLYKGTAHSGAVNRVSYSAGVSVEDDGDVVVVKTAENASQKASSESEASGGDKVLLVSRLTYLQLPWYTLLWDILNSDKKPVL